MLRVLATVLPRTRRLGLPAFAERPPRMSVVLAAYNEERVIGRRVENLLALDYPRDRLEVIVASDGSTDRTVDIASRFADPGVTVLDLPRQGKALAHNAAVARATGDILVFTDADSEFEPDFLGVVARTFHEDPRVGCVVGNLTWKAESTATARFKNLYWGIETDQRRLESRLGILAGSTGAGMAVRRSLWRPMSGPVDDADSVTPLDVILQGYRVVFAEDARVIDVHFASVRGEMRAKIRGVSKSVVMILRRWGVRGWLAHPVVSWRLVSHHFLRWASPYVLLGLVTSSVFLLDAGPGYRAFAALEAAGAVLAAAGWLAERRQARIAVASTLFTFVAVNVGMGIGLFRGLVNAARGPWEPE